ncbi:hypothetical protein [Sphingomonas solaris]|uniref:hypothetical protein n=1 Tax=Alterirhizorhabdus solaris TaxID=2529389 RepID=UPI001396BA5F|nr:hypothetical protein [Sphingomonas solaris]
MKINVSPVVWMDKPEAFYAVGRNLRQAFQPALTTVPDRGVDALMALLMETPLNDMASC